MTPDTIATIAFAAFGLCIGSFLNVVIHRLPRGASVVTPPSRCPGCNYQLRWSDNVPVLSWIFLRGRCRKCRAPISIRYPIVEILTMLMFLLHLWLFGWSALLVDSILGTLLGGGVLWAIGEAYYRYSGQEGMGGGDVKMLAMIGAFLGWKLVLVTLVLSSVGGSLIGVLVIAIKRGGMKHALPYGTFLALGALAASLVGDRILAWYLGMYEF